jgi:hypothetical protein
MTCSAGSDNLALIAHQTDEAMPISLVIGDERFDADGEAVKTSFGERFVEGKLPLTEHLLSALSAPAAGAGLRIGDSQVDAPPAEVLPLLAQQCRFLRTQTPAPKGGADPLE